METRVSHGHDGELVPVLRENHSGMETVEAKKDSFVLEASLRENHSGMETSVQYVYI